MSMNQEIVPVQHTSDISKSRRIAKMLVQKIKFSIEEREEVGLVVSELASNLINHAHGGCITLRLVQKDDRTGLEVESIDEGPGIEDIKFAMTDGCSTMDSLGYGLGTVLRLTDELDIQPNHNAGQGIRIICRKWEKQLFNDNLLCPLEVGVMTRPHYQMTQNGDAFVIKRWSHMGLVAVIDGLGHGAHAYKAAQTARQYIENHPEQSIAELFQGVGCICRSTRGVVMAIARFDCSCNQLIYGSLGNIDSHLISSFKSNSLLARRGIIGVTQGNPAITSCSWKPGDIIILHTDGLSSRWHWNDFSHLKDKPVATIAKHMLDKLGKEEDDSTVLVVRYITE